MKNRPIFSAYCSLIVLNVFVQTALRMAEYLMILIRQGPQDALIVSELLGLACDMVITNALMLSFYPLFFLIARKSLGRAVRIFLVFIAGLGILHILILDYFIYQLVPLDIFLFRYTLKEIYYTVTTSGKGLVTPLLVVAAHLVFILMIWKFLKRKDLSDTAIKGIFMVCLVFIAATILRVAVPWHLNKFTENKSLYFYSRSLALFWNRGADTEYTAEDVLKYQQLQPARSFCNAAYPLLHELDTTHVLEPYFNRFDSPPNIVIVVVEGLNDDFIHAYKGVKLMPVLSNLAHRSLYWSRCFAVGERSFAVMPSILGSLPYGESGFTLMNILPRHMSLVSILNTNGYFTSFFYGQGSWFHRKNRFFRYNNIDLIVDNDRFSDRYQKIIVGPDRFFWGYNDKDLFEQAFRVTDTLTAKPRLDIYFTGTSHSPYAITDLEKYDRRFSAMMETIKSNENRKFFTSHKKYIESVFFVDDALELFFKTREQQPDYENTIFIITGDHPMSEIPTQNALKKYHVPLIVFSPRLNTSAEFMQTVSHLDIFETLLSFLAGCGIEIPPYSAALGGNLGNVHEPRRIAFMNDNREINDYLCGAFFISGQKLYRVGEDLSLTPVKDDKKSKRLANELAIFKKINRYVSTQDKILSDSLYCKSLGFSCIASLPRIDKFVRFNDEYYILVPQTPVQDRTFYFDIAFDHYGGADDGFSLVYQLTGRNDSTVYWQNTGVMDDPRSFQAHIAISVPSGADSLLYFRSFLWNRNHRNFAFRNLRYSIYAKQ